MSLGPRLMTTPGARGAKPPKSGPRPPLKIEARIGVRAPADVVWEAIRDVGEWASWSPIFEAAVGELRVGGTLELTESIAGLAVQTASPKIVDWVPAEQILLTQTILGGWATSLRYFEIDSLTDTAAIFSNGRVFKGLWAELHGKRHKRAYRMAFEAHCEAVKARAEAMWNST